jgi:thermostable 8-oxoguanine DNA glycosylase
MDDLFINVGNYVEDYSTSLLINNLSDIKTRGYLTQNEFIQIGMWKSPRQKQNYLKNSDNVVEAITLKSLSTLDEKDKIIILTGLKGVLFPTASAILTLTDPQNYGVIDIRVWQTLHSYGLVKRTPSGIGLTSADWIEYLTIIRSLAKKYNTSSRAIEQVLFHHHKLNLQTGNLYDKLQD